MSNILVVLFLISILMFFESIIIGIYHFVTKSDSAFPNKIRAVISIIFLSVFLMIIIVNGNFEQKDETDVTQPTYDEGYNAGYYEGYSDAKAVESKNENQIGNNEIKQTATQEPEEQEPSFFSNATIEQKNAYKQALSYLEHSAFSYSDLIKQLEFEGYPTETATWAVDNCGADWNEQAAKQAESYLSHSSYSHSNLVKQLEFEGFTHEQAEYGVSQTGL